jgi:hypothetical protein
MVVTNLKRPTNIKVWLKAYFFLIMFLCFWSPHIYANGKSSKKILSAGAGFTSRVILQNSRKDLYEGFSPVVAYYYGSNLKWGLIVQSTSYTANYTEITPYTESVLLYGLAVRADLAKNGKVFFETQLLAGNNSSYGMAVAGVFRIPFGVGSKIGVFGKYQILTGPAGAEYGFTPGVSLELDL